MRSILNIIGILVALIGSCLIVYDNHYITNGYSYAGLWVIIFAVPLSILTVRLISMFCLEVAYRVNKKNLRVKTFRRPRIAIIYIFGLAALVVFFGYRFFTYIETSAHSMAETFYSMLFPIGIGWVLSFSSTFLDY